MTNTEARTTELMAMTAKALRPIAASLEITGASRMAKADIVAAIVKTEAALETGVELSLREKYEGTPARFNPEVIDEVHALAFELDERRTIARAFLSTPDGVVLTEDEIDEGVAGAAAATERLIDKYDRRWSMSFPLAKDGDGNVMQGHADYCATWGHATNVDNGEVSSWCPRCGDTLPAEQVEAKRAELLSWIEPEETAADNLGPIAETDGRCAYGNIHEIETCFGCGTEDENGNQVELFIRTTRRGTETVERERVHAGRVDYRILDPKTGRRSMIYRMRQATFERTYSRVSA